ncbi:MAG: Zn-ribbon domain-containing OB-fold protein [Dehalococcoidia bacterium]|nr:Zn-ribbon domain-containing OB-fold protein [Dehalococcoidia bacterium]
MGASEAKKKVPIKEGLFKVHTDEEEGYLIGSRCKKCGEYFHPKRVVCANCYSEDMDEVALSTRGKIFTYTIARTSYPGTPLTAPFITAHVELPEKVSVISLITDIDLDKVKVGMEVELYFWKAREDGEGNEVMAYAFRPVSN